MKIIFWVVPNRYKQYQPNHIIFICFVFFIFLNFFGVFRGIYRLCVSALLQQMISKLELKFAMHKIDVQNTVKVKYDDFEFYQVWDAKVQWFQLLCLKIEDECNSYEGWMCYCFEWQRKYTKSICSERRVGHGKYLSCTRWGGFITMCLRRPRLKVYRTSCKLYMNDNQCRIRSSYERSSTTSRWRRILLCKNILMSLILWSID